MSATSVAGSLPATDANRVDVVVVRRVRPIVDTRIKLAEATAKSPNRKRPFGTEPANIIQGLSTAELDEHEDRRPVRRIPNLSDSVVTTPPRRRPQSGAVPPLELLDAFSGAPPEPRRALMTRLHEVIICFADGTWDTEVVSGTTGRDAVRRKIEALNGASKAVSHVDLFREDVEEDEDEPFTDDSDKGIFCPKCHKLPIKLREERAFDEEHEIKLDMDGTVWHVRNVDPYAPEYTDIVGYTVECSCGEKWTPSPKALWLADSCDDEEWDETDADNPQDEPQRQVALAKFKDRLRKGEFDKPPQN